MQFLKLVFITLILFSNFALANDYSLLIIGDSLTEGYGVSKEAAYPSQLEKLLVADGKKIKIINAGSSGSTSASLEKRLSWHLKKKPTHLMIALGANDGLRGVEPESMRKNLSSAIQKAQGAGIKVIFAGMKMPLNYGKQYREKYEKVFTDLGKTKGVFFIPFLLKGVGGIKKLNQADGIHPNEVGHKKMAEFLFETLKGEFK